MNLVDLSEIAEINPREKAGFSPDERVGFIPMSAVSEQGTIETITYRPFAEVSKGYTSFRNNDLLFAKITPCMENGKAAVVKGLQSSLGFGSTEFHVIRPKKEASVDYLFQYLHNTAFRIEAAKNMTGSAGQKRVPTQYLAKVQIPLPPLPEQIRIADMLSRAEKLIAQRKESLALLDELVKSRFVEMFGDPVRNEKGWEEVNLEDLFSRIVDCPHSTPVYTDEPDGYPCIRTSDIQNGSLDFSTTKYVSKIEYEKRIQRHTPAPNDIIYSREGERFGMAAIIPKDTYVCLGQRVMLFIVKAGVTNERFAWAMLNSPFIYNQALNLVSGTTSPHVNIKDIRRFGAILPPLPLQNAFASFVEKIEALKRRYQQSLGELENLYGSLSQRAFGGELTNLSTAKAAGSGKTAQADQTQTKPISEMTLDEYYGVPEEIIAEHGYLDGKHVDYEFLMKKYFTKRPIEAQTFEELFNREYYDAGHSFDYDEFRKTIIGNLENPNGFLMQIYNVEEKKIEIRLK